MIRALLLVLAVARATRFFTSDWLGEWTIVGPAKRWAGKYEGAALDAALDEYEPENPHTAYLLSDGTTTHVPAEYVMDRYDEHNPLTWQGKLVSMFSCPFCIGFHLGWIALLGELTIARLPVLGAVWRFGVSAFALNYVVGHVSSRLD